MQPRPFRFGTGTFGVDRAELLRTARATESAGYDVFVVPDHLGREMSPLLALAVVAEHTGLRISPHVLCNDFHHPVVLAKEAATLDELSGGRLELGMGAGWVRREYEAAGIPFDAARVRVDRLAEAVQVLKGVLAGGPFTFEGTHYRVHDQAGFPMPAQPHLPLVLGGGGRRVLSLAAREADIVSIIPGATMSGRLRASQVTTASVEERSGWVRTAAGHAFSSLELNLLVVDVVVTTDRRGKARELRDRIVQGRHRMLEADIDLADDDLLDSPYFLFGTVDQITEQVEELRARCGISYLTVFPHNREAFAPVVERLAGVRRAADV